jgi:hypothetical protein
MIGLDFPVKPEWVHAVHHLWQPEQPVKELVKASLDNAMPELGGEKTRRNSLSIILRNFVSVDGGARGHTAVKDVWVAFSRRYPVSTMAPAYLAQVIAHNEVAQFAARLINQRHAPGDTFSSRELRQRLSAQYGQRKVVTNSASAFLSTLQYFGVLAEGEKRYHYRYLQQLKVDRSIFPLLVWVYWKANSQPQIDLDEFDQFMTESFLETVNFADFWGSYQPEFWVLLERLERKAATLKVMTEKDWEDKLLSEVL